MWSLVLDPKLAVESGGVLSIVAIFGLVLVIGFVASVWVALPAKQAPRTEPDIELEESQVVLHTTDEVKTHALSCGRPECQQISSQCCSHYQALLTYFEDFLAKPHKDVGRTGTVCPFVPLSLKKQTLLVGMARTSPSKAGEAPTFGAEDMVSLVRRLRERFLAMEPISGRLKLYKAIVVGFPDISDDNASQLIDQVQKRLKIEFTQCGMMIGEFHRRNTTPGLRNPAFCPLQTPIPALAIRFMVPTDVLFLKHDPEYLKAYLSIIPDTRSNADYRAEAEEAMAAFEKGELQDA